VVDTIMDRARAGGLRVATASDFGLIASLFVRGTPRIDGIAYVQDGSRVRPPPPITWPVDEARRVGSIDELGAAIARLVGGGAALLGVPAPGHAEGRALVELLALSPADARRRAELDAARARATVAVAAAARDEQSVPDPARLAIAAVAVALAVALAIALHRRG